MEKIEPVKDLEKLIDEFNQVIKDFKGSPPILIYNQKLSETLGIDIDNVKYVVFNSPDGKIRLLIEEIAAVCEESELSNGKCIIFLKGNSCGLYILEDYNTVMEILKESGPKPLSPPAIKEVLVEMAQAVAYYDDNGDK